MSIPTLLNFRDFLQIEEEYNNPFKQENILNKIKFVQLAVYKFFKIYNFAEIDFNIACTLTDLVCNIYNNVKELLQNINGETEPIQQKKSAFDELDEEEDRKLGIIKDDSKEYYENFNKYILSILRYCRQKKIDVNTRIDILIDIVKDEMEYDEEHKDDYKDL